MSRRYQSKPSFSEVSEWKRAKKSPLSLVYFDDQGRSYGKRTDPAFASEHHGDAQAWWVNLPPLKIKHPKVGDLIDFPKPGSEVAVQATDDETEESIELLLKIVEYPEVIKRGQKTASVNVKFF
jgi:hypothetical protein